MEQELQPQEVQAVQEPVLQTEQQPVAVEPQAEIPVQVPPPKKSHPIAIIISVIILLLLGGGAFALISKNGLLSKPPAADDALVSAVLDKVEHIDSARYSVSISAQTEPREADAVPLASAVPEVGKNEQIQADDQQRYQSFQEVNTAVSLYYDDNKNTYPATLGVLTPTYLASVRDFDRFITYKLLNGGKDYEFTVTFSSEDYLKNAQLTKATIQGKTVTVETGGSFYPAAGESSTMAGPGPLEFLDELFSNVNDIPSNFKLSGFMDGILRSPSAAPLEDLTFHVGGDVTSEDFSAAIDLEFTKIKDVFYAKVNKLPGLFTGADISAIKEKWIQITKNDRVGWNYDFLSLNNVLTDTNEKSVEPFLAQVKLFFQTAQDDKAVHVSGGTKEEINSQTMYRYAVRFDRDKFADFYKHVASKIAQEYPDNPIITYDEATYQDLKDPAFARYYDYLEKNTDLTLRIDKSGQFSKLSYSVRVVPTAPEKKNVQMRATVSISLSDVNKNPDIQEPKDFISFEDASIALSGETKEQYRYGAQLGRIRSIKSALENYKRYAGTYPSTLDDLLKNVSDVQKNSTVTPLPGYGSYPTTYKFLESIPADIYTGQAFGYKQTGNDFELTYTVHLPPYEKGKEENFQQYDPITHAYKFQLPALEGTNTASATVDSKEAAASLQDTDADGLPDSLEKYIGTDSSKKDTDGDGYSDGDELKEGYDPLGTGKLTPNPLHGGLLP